MASSSKQALETRYAELLGELLPSAAGAKVSRREREDTGRGNDRDLVYGEMGFSAVLEILSRVFPGDEQDKVLVDLGSGAGKAILAAAVARPSTFAELVGVETLEGLHALAAAAAEAFDDQAVSFLHEDFRTCDSALLARADLVLVHCSCFSETTNLALAKRLRRYLKPGAVVATVSVDILRLLRGTVPFDNLDTFLTALDGGQEALVFLSRRRMIVVEDAAAEEG